MVGIVYLKTNKFDVKLEGIAFKVEEFESLCNVDFLFPEGKVRHHKPIVGLDVMRHPRDSNILLLFLCVGIGCVILRFHVKERLPKPIIKFLTDQRIHFVGFKIPEKRDLFPFQELGLRKSKVDVGYMAAKLLNDPKLKKFELSELARKVIGVSKMVGLAEASSFERHEQIKIALCEVFISSVIAMMLLDPKKKHKSVDSLKKNTLAVKKMDPPRMPKTGKLHNCPPTAQSKGEILVQPEEKGIKVRNDSGKVVIPSSPNKPVRGILKLPSFSNLGGCDELSPHSCSSPSTSKGQKNAKGAYLKRANSKGHNVSFSEKLNDLHIC